MNDYKAIKTVTQENAVVQVSSNMFSKGIRLTVHIPENIPEAIKQQKINKIYDILTPENF